MNKSASRLAAVLPALLGIGLFALSIWALHQELQHYQRFDLLQSLRSLPAAKLLLALTLTKLNYVAIATYDSIAVRYVRHPLPYRQTALVSGISTAVGNSVGFALLSGSAIRYRLYSAWGLSAMQIARIIAFSSLSFWLGLFAVAGGVFTILPPPIPATLNLPLRSARSIGVLFVAIIAVYLLWNLVSRRPIRLGRFTLPHVPIQLAIAQIAVAAVDWSLAASVLYVLLPVSPTYSSYLGIFLLAQIAGVISNVPGGLGVFETVVILMLSHSISTPALFGSLIAYRGIYYLLPLAIATLLLGGYELRTRMIVKRS
ncbi:UPF0104 family protein [Microcoleus sp. FACHB-1515]|uniref:lysylphosphatidylglycerol synthase domain-containing protein n=1 Tax=Cyanophyceae TaxID=3028117 RepID=UPI001683B652|nr:lysylphosphatidylglycerol synthase domain-containing protein [Microcoleus sp. FACHB-1515]MBD2089218.1 UPF0104 family protein [Microcoleus sp. FACHB-1515]